MSSLTPKECEKIIHGATTAFNNGEYLQCVELVESVLKSYPKHGKATHIFGLAHLQGVKELKQPQLAEYALQRALNANPKSGMVHMQFGMACALMGNMGKALYHMNRALDLKLDKQNTQQIERLRDEYALAGIISGEWVHFDAVHKQAAECLLRRHGVIHGEHALASPYFDASLLKTGAFRFSVLKAQEREFGPEYIDHQRKTGGITRIGFIGQCFYEQATHYLMLDFIKALDRTKYRVYAYDHGGKRELTQYRRQVIDAYDKYADISEMHDYDASQLIYNDGIDLLLNINSPAQSRTGVFARRPARRQAAYLYYPGTSAIMGIEHIIADYTVLPPDLEKHFMEHVWRMEGCYQPNSQRPLPSASCGPLYTDGTVILANFGQSYKITPPVFRSWLEIMRQREKTVLWLLDTTEERKVNMLGMASQYGIAGNRITFGPMLDQQSHIDRLSDVDIMLDTYPYGGHTGTSDALWAGTPVITMIGQTFASRVAASLLMACNMRLLITDDATQYIQMAINLIDAPEERQRLREHLIWERERGELFDSTCYARRFEAIVEQMLDY